MKINPTMVTSDAVATGREFLDSEEYKALCRRFNIRQSGVISTTIDIQANGQVYVTQNYALTVQEQE